MKKAPLSVDASYPTLIHLISSPEGADEGGYEVEYDVQVWQSANNERTWRVQLGVKFKPKGSAVAAHQGEVRYVGIFTVVEEYSTELMYRLIAVDAPSILYSSIRELVALLTGRSATKMVLLPAVSFFGAKVAPLADAAKQVQLAQTAKQSAVAARGKKPSHTRAKAKP
jgi:preprotein translocase subunit SecB